MKKLPIFLVVAALLIVTGCIEEDEANRRERLATQALTAEATSAVGMPALSNFTEKRFVRMLYELRDNAITTYSYTQDMNGRLHFLCNSIGYGIPASVQFSNPQAQVNGRGQGWVMMPQPEPNGLFMPEGLHATYVMCGTSAGDVKPVYVEQDVMVSPFKLKSVDDLS